MASRIDGLLFTSKFLAFKDVCDVFCCSSSFADVLFLKKPPDWGVRLPKALIAWDFTMAGGGFGPTRASFFSSWISRDNLEVSSAASEKLCWRWWGFEALGRRINRTWKRMALDKRD